MTDRRKLLWLILAATAARLLIAWRTPLIAGEAYYWLWGRHLAAGYFDHPPMTAWTSALLFGWIDGSVVAARAAPILLFALSLWALFALSRALFPDGRSAWLSALFFAAAPLFLAGGAMVGPDAPLLLFMLLAWRFFWLAAESGKTGWWLAAGAAAGAALLSKFHAWVLLPPLWVFLAFSPSHRARLKTPGPWMALAVALLVLSPNLIWNAQHGWINYAFQWRRSDLPEARLNGEDALEYALGPILTLGPILYWIAAWGAWRGFALWRADRDPRWLYLLFAGLPLPLFLGVLSWVVTISLHWPAAGYLPLFVLAARLIERGAMRGPRLARAAVWTGAGMSAAGILALLFVQHLPEDIESPFRSELANVSRLKRKFLGDRELAAAAAAIQDELRAQGSAEAVIMAPKWHLASLMAFYTGRVGDVFAFEADSAHNFAIWMRERGGLIGADAAVIIRISATPH